VLTILSANTVLKELKFHIKRIIHQRDKQQVTQVVSSKQLISATFSFKVSYFLFLRAVDYELRTTGSVTSAFVFNNAPSIPLSLECIGHLSKFYFIPWKCYASVAEFDSILFPWQLIRTGMSLLPNRAIELIQQAKQHGDTMYSHSDELRALGYEALGKKQEASNQRINVEIAKYEKIVGAKNEFYKNEVNRFILGNRESQGEALYKQIEKYELRMKREAKLSRFFHQTHN